MHKKLELNIKKKGIFLEKSKLLTFFLYGIREFLSKLLTILKTLLISLAS